MIEIVDVSYNDLVDMARIEAASIVHENRSDGYAPGLEELVSLWQRPEESARPLQRRR